ncbi:MAG: alanine racemase [Candidatus Eisenbacteria bacterium]|nr:alanine racemase [Candidatus Eisenbacteria bacterium]
MDRYPVWAEVDLDAIAHNSREIRKLIGPKRGIILVVKADGYGLGAIAVAHEAARSGVERLAVATLDEAVELREAGVDLPILMFNPPMAGEAERVARYEIEPSIIHIGSAREYAEACRKRGVVGRYQVEIDTGMGRWGIFVREAVRFLAELAAIDGIELAGIYTHFPATSKDQIACSLEQIRSFDRLIAALRAEGIEPPLVHAANSACLCWGLEGTYLDAVRPGILLYGFIDPEKVPPGISIRSAVALKSRVVQARKCEGGETISYGLTYRVPGPTTIATVPVGYGHGYNRRLSNGGEVIIRERRVPIVGQITMDAFMVDCQKVPEVEAGDEVVLIGRMGEEEISVAELAERTDRLAYEVTLAIGRRVPRVYTRSQRPLWARTMLGSRSFDGT